MNEQFLRTAMLLGEDAMERLKSAHVAVFGIGGVGGYVVEALARAGIGHLTLIDSDTISLSTARSTSKGILPEKSGIQKSGTGSPLLSSSGIRKPVCVRRYGLSSPGTSSGVNTIYQGRLSTYSKNMSRSTAEIRSSCLRVFLPPNRLQSMAKSGCLPVSSIKYS